MSGSWAPPPVPGAPAAPAETTATVLSPPPFRGATPPPPAVGERPRFRRAWRIAGACFAVGALTLAGLQVLGALSLESQVIERSVPAGGLSTVVVRADQGSVEVIGSDTAVVAVEARVRRSLTAADVDVRRGDDRAVVRGTCPGFSPGFCGVDLVVRVPVGVGVEVQGRDGDVSVRGVRGPVVISADDGDVAADDLGGPLTVDVSQGTVRASGLSGSADVATDDGSVTLGFGAPPSAVSVSTGTGDIEVVVPDGPETYLVDGTADDGTVDTMVRTDPVAERTMTLRSGDGSVAVRYPA